MDNQRESGTDFDPKFDAAGLLTAVVTDVADGTVLMVGHMNAEALAKSRETGLVHFFSRSRQRLWQKGESSGNVLKLIEMRIDCDQDAVLVIAEPAGPTCHTGERSCFYRRLADGRLQRI
jgi:phosphoribosyl-AMP cyclohydrolase